MRRNQPRLSVALDRYARLLAGVTDFEAEQRAWEQAIAIRKYLAHCRN